MRWCNTFFVARLAFVRPPPPARDDVCRETIHSSTRPSELNDAFIICLFRNGEHHSHSIPTQTRSLPHSLTHTSLTKSCDMPLKRIHKCTKDETHHFPPKRNNGPTCEWTQKMKYDARDGCFLCESSERVEMMRHHLSLDEIFAVCSSPFAHTRAHRKLVLLTDVCFHFPL